MLSVEKKRLSAKGGLPQASGFHSGTGGVM